MPCRKQADGALASGRLVGMWAWVFGVFGIALSGRTLPGDRNVPHLRCPMAAERLKCG